MSENEYTSWTGVTIIVNGGDPLPGCPLSWDEAHKIEDALNAGRDYEPRWKFDCGFKLDYDGGLVTISSRFYPPKNHYGPTWDGTVSICMLDEDLEDKKFDCPTLEQLAKEVNEYVDSVKSRIKAVFRNSK